MVPNAKRIVEVVRCSVRTQTNHIVIGCNLRGKGMFGSPCSPGVHAQFKWLSGEEREVVFVP